MTPPRLHAETLIALAVPTAGLDDFQTRVLAELAAIRRLLERQAAGCARDAADLALLAQIADTTALPFTCRGLFAHVRLRNDAALRQAMVAADIVSARQLGKFLQRCTGTHGDVSVTRALVPQREGALWQVLRESRE